MFDTIVYNPLYNAMVFLIGHMPGYSVGLSVIILTIVVKLALFPLSKNVSKMQINMKKIQPEMEKIKERYKNDKQNQTKKILELYKKENVNPFSGFFVMIIQLPVMFGLYWVFFKGGLPNIHLDILYSFINGDISPNMVFLGSINMSGRSIVIALLAGVTQFINMQIITPKKDGKELNDINRKLSVKDDFAKSMQTQMKYVLPVIIGFVSYTISAAIGLYILVSNVFTILQELWVRK